MTPRSRDSDDRLSWITSALIAAACVLWWTFARSDRVAAFVFDIRDGQPVFDSLYLFRRVVFVRIAGVACAVALISAGFAMRKRPVRGTWGTLLFVGAAAGSFVLLWSTGRSMAGKPVLSVEGLVSLGIYMVGLAAWLLRRRAEIRQRVPIEP
jgi:hypothetical protein